MPKPVIASIQGPAAGIGAAAPIPAAGPCIEAITGLGIEIIFSNEGLKPLNKASFDPSQLASASDKSAPEEKALPEELFLLVLIYLKLMLIGMDQRMLC